MRKNLSYYDKSHPQATTSSHPRHNGKTGGRLVVVHKNHIKLQTYCILQTLGMMECGCFQIKFGSEIVSLFVIYHIPNTSVLQFSEEMLSIFENSIETISNKILLMGDFNIHMDRPDNPNTIIFNDFLDSLNLRNNISFQTHISGHTLDLILDDCNELLVKCVKKGTPLQNTVWYKQLSAWRNAIQ